MDSTQPDDSHNPDVKIILFLAANPESTLRLQLDKEIREIDEGLRRGSKHERFKLEQKWAVRQRDFYRAILDYQPQIVHFSGHGTGLDGIILENETDEPAFINADALASMFKLFATEGVECVFLNACYSEVQAKAISQYVNYVIGMNQTIDDKAAIAFSVAFYDAIAAGQQMEFAYELGCSVLMNYLEQQIPVLLKKDHFSVIQPLRDVIPPNPYLGLAAFTEKDAAFFFGREIFVNGLVEAVKKQPLVAVIGPSGSGKSSVVYAGLIPQLRIAENWLIESFRPGDRPFYQLASVLVHLLEPEVGQTVQLREAVGLATDMELGRITLQQVISRLLDYHPNKRLLLFADQFEELYTLCQNKEVIERFVDALLAAINLKNFTLVFTLRADFYNFVLAYRPFRDALQQFTPQLLSSMNHDELCRAIEQPVHKMSVFLEAQLAQRILDDVGNEPGNLPLLEFALTQLWEKQQKRLLTHQAYDEIGGVKKALANHAEQVYQQLNSQQQKVVPRIFIQLVHPGEGTEDTRRVATRAEVGEENWDLVTRLADARLVVTGRNDKTGLETVEIVHEALIRNWLHLNLWMQLDRDFRHWQEQLRTAMHTWESSSNDEGALLRGKPLADAESWYSKRLVELNNEERCFIQLSLELRDRTIKIQQRRRQLTIWGLSTGLLFAFSLAGVAGWEWQKVRINEINLLRSNAETFLTSNLDFDALVTSIRGANRIQQTFSVDTHTRSQLVETLLQAVNFTREYNRLENHIEEGRDSVNDAVFSPDGNIIATASSDKTVKLWSRDGKLLDTLYGHKNGVICVSFSPDGNIIASGSRDGTVKLWSKDGKKLQTLYGHQQDINSISFSPDGNIIATASSDKTVKLWSKEGKELKTLRGHKDGVFGVSFSPDGNIIATASGDKTVKLWSKEGKELQTLKGHKGGVNSVIFSPDGNTIATAGWDETIRLWSKEGKQKYSFPAHYDIINKLSFSHDGKIIASASSDKTAKLWSLNGQQLDVLRGHDAVVSSVAFSPDGKQIATASQDKTVMLWNRDNKEVYTLRGHQQLVYSVVFSPDGNTIASASWDNTVKLWSRDGEELHTLRGHTGKVNNVSFSPDGNTIATASEDRTVKLWSRDGKYIKTLTGHQGNVWNVSFSPDGNTIATASEDRTVKLWNRDGKYIKTLTGHEGGVNSVKFSPDGRTIATGSWDNTVRLWNRDGKELKTLRGHTSGVNSVAFSPDSSIIATGSWDNTVRLWNRDGKELKTLRGHRDIINSVVFSPDGNIIASASSDKIVKLWNRDGTLLRNLRGHDDAVWSVNFSPDGKTVVTGSGDKTVIVWNSYLEDLKPLLVRACTQVRDYLQNNPNVSPEDRGLCNGI